MSGRGFLGILFCGGRGRRLGNITDSISKALIPVCDKPVFHYGLEALKAADAIEEILILSNNDNDNVLAATGYPTLVQDDALVGDMFSGLDFIRKCTGDRRPAVMMPCDNISEIRVDDVIRLFCDQHTQLAFSIRQVEDLAKLRQMGVFDPTSAHMEYRPEVPRGRWGVVAPYVASPDLVLTGLSECEVFNRHRLAWLKYSGSWFDIGDPDSLFAAAEEMQRRASEDR